jgi:hypothetical protein
MAGVTLETLVGNLQDWIFLSMAEILQIGIEGREVFSVSNRLDEAIQT